MRGVLGSVPQMLLMAVIVASLLYFPVGAVLALLCALIGVSLQAFVTFGGALGTLAGMLAWWLLGFAGALVYAACVFPWSRS